jgi:hypothetical protein
MKNHSVINGHKELLAMVFLFSAVSAESKSIRNDSTPPFPVIACSTQTAQSSSPLPEDGKVIFAEYENNWAQLKKDTVKKLVTLQDKYTKAGQLDEALTIRTKVWQLSGLITCWQQPTEADIGKKILFEVTGTTKGNIWGSGPYTNDTHPGVAAVHSGLIKSGEKKLLEFEIVPGPNEFAGSIKNGITSNTYGPWPVAYVIRTPTFAL